MGFTTSGTRGCPCPLPARLWSERLLALDRGGTIYNRRFVDILAGMLCELQFNVESERIRQGHLSLVCHSIATLIHMLFVWYCYNTFCEVCYLIPLWKWRKKTLKTFYYVVLSFFRLEQRWTPFFTFAGFSFCPVFPRSFSVRLVSFLSSRRSCSQLWLSLKTTLLSKFLLKKVTFLNIFTCDPHF